MEHAFGKFTIEEIQMCEHSLGSMSDMGTSRKPMEKNFIVIDSSLNELPEATEKMKRLIDLNKEREEVLNYLMGIKA
jgi:hypothetical protein